MPELALANARIVTPDGLIAGSLAMRAGAIAAVDAGGIVGEDCEGDYLLPGIVDMHTDNLEKHFFPRQSIDWDPISAAIIHDCSCAALGVTTIYDSLSVGSFGGGASRTEENLARLVRGLGEAAAAGMLKIDHKIHWRCELTAGDMAAELNRLVDHPLTGLFSLMDHTPGQRQYRNVDRFLKYWSSEGLTEAEIQARLGDRKARQAEHVGVNRKVVSDLARGLRIPLASHDDETVEHINDGAEAGATIAEFPVTLEAAAHARVRGMAVIMGGPNLIRGGSYSGNVGASDVAQAGLLDGFASDYVPRSLIECAFVLAAEPYNWPLERAWATVSSVPADALGLSDRGRIAVGQRADLIRVRLIEGRPIVRGVWVAGARVA